MGKAHWQRHCVKITSEDKQSELLIESCCPELTCYPSVWVNLRLKTQKYPASKTKVWISEDELNSFLHALKHSMQPEKEM